MKFTAFCQEVSGTGTIWIDTVEANDTPGAIVTARKACAEAWDYDEEDIHVLGIIAGDVQVLHWMDICDTVD